MRNFCIKRPDGVLARIVVHPSGAAFDHYVIVEEAGVVKFKLWVYTLEADEMELGLFKAKWKTSNELIIRIPSRQTEISVYVKECKATMRQLAKHFISPFESRFVHYGV
ncbi:MAG TPA: hypothetical protein VHD83_13585 [Puia sp.]|nr:hypothetical protein [Puia sp.]